MQTKEAFHKLIDAIEDKNMLDSYYHLIQQLNENQIGKLWCGLTTEQKSELILAYEESFDQKNLITNEEVKMQHEKWLEK
jgi:hypothetical protein